MLLVLVLSICRMHFASIKCLSSNIKTVIMYGIPIKNNVVCSFLKIWATGLLALASQRVETLCYQLLGLEDAAESAAKERGSLPGLIESLIIIYVISK